jgi:hypothetical protein
MMLCTVIERVNLGTRSKFSQLTCEIFEGVLRKAVVFESRTTDMGCSPLHPPVCGETEGEWKQFLLYCQEASIRISPLLPDILGSKLRDAKNRFS